MSDVSTTICNLKINKYISGAVSQFQFHWDRRMSKSGYLSLRVSFFFNISFYNYLSLLLLVSNANSCQFLIQNSHLVTKYLYIIKICDIYLCKCKHLFWLFATHYFTNFFWGGYSFSTHCFTMKKIRFYYFPKHILVGIIIW